MRILYADLEREWRGGQSQALLTLQGLVAGESSGGVGVRRTIAAGAARRAVGKSPVHASPRFGLRAWAAQAMARLSGAGVTVGGGAIRAGAASMSRML